MSSGSMRCWATSLQRAGVSDDLLKSWNGLKAAIVQHQKILAENGIGKQVSERDRIRVNAKRVGLEAPLFADEAQETFSDILSHAFKTRRQEKQKVEDNMK